MKHSSGHDDQRDTSTFPKLFSESQYFGDKKKKKDPYSVSYYEETEVHGGKSSLTVAFLEILTPLALERQLP
jgi:hypothetical protein